MRLDRLQLRLPLTAALMAAWVVASSGCGSFRLPGVYRLDIQQGNVVTREMLAQLEPGMDRRKVRFILGTPLVTDTFNEDRWDYVYSFKEGNGDRMQRHVSIYFDNDRLIRIEGDVNSGLVPENFQSTSETIVTVPVERPKEGILGGLVPDFMSDRPVRHKRKAPSQAQDASTGSNGSEQAARSNAGDSSTEPEAAASVDLDDGARLQELFGDYGRLDAPNAGEGTRQ